jgi:acetyl-CoA carboxylase carboxyltransferase component
VGINDSGGARIQKAWTRFPGSGNFFPEFQRLGSYSPDIGHHGDDCGRRVYSPAMTDWVFMTKNSSYMFITGPDVIRSVTGEK